MNSVPNSVVSWSFDDHAAPRMSLGMHVANLCAVVLPFLGLAAAVIFFWGWGFRWVELGLLLGMYIATALGITVGFHRLFTHQAFETNRLIQCILAILGSMAVQGPLLKSVALHRRHHQRSDQEEDPHSPHHQGGGLLGLVRGAWHAQLGWIFKPDPPNLSHYIKDLRQSGLARTLSALFPVWVAVGLLIPALLGGLLTLSWTGALLGLLWGGLARIFLVHHVTWSVNSICHLSYVGPPVLPDCRSKPQQLAVWHPGARRRLAQQPPCLSHLGPARPEVVAGRRELWRHSRPRRARHRLEGEIAHDRRAGRSPRVRELTVQSPEKMP
jgi:stearoyl-CoA desaturase (delta-9 desaturase)